MRNRLVKKDQTISCYSLIVKYFHSTPILIASLMAPVLLSAQDYGLRTDTRWVRMTDISGVGCTARGIFDAYRVYPAGYERTLTVRPVIR